MIIQSPGTNLDDALQKEWLETNGLGGFASSTVVGLNTRRYHGLLIAATNPPVGRLVLLSKLEETLVAAGQRFDLSCNRYPGVIHPQGHLYLAEFRLRPFPTFIYQAGGVVLEKRVFMPQGENTTVVEYEARGEGIDVCKLEVRPLIAFRDYHSLTQRNDAIDWRVAASPGRTSIVPYKDLPPLQFAHHDAHLHVTGDWYLNFEYQMEQERGLDFREDLFNPFALEFELSRRTAVSIVVSTQEAAVDQAAGMRERETLRRESVRQAAPVDDEFVRDLVTAADSFIVKRGELQTVIAGYHWFGDWGRDTMIALPGLTFVSRRYDAAKNILRAFVNSVDHGMIPNRWPDAGERPEYNTVDATLWLFEALASLLRHTGDYAFARELFPTLMSVIEWHRRGTRFNIHVNEHGLLACGDAETQLTWMDARVGDRPVTPRHGMPVEIQALWYNALLVCRDLARKFDDLEVARSYEKMAEAAKQSFSRLFWNGDNQCLYDVVEGEVRDPSIRPNQILALSLTHPILVGERALQVLRRVERDLLTPRGLRTLAPSDPAYRGHYQGGVAGRDSAYHQGTVWPWLLGPFVTAYVRAHQGSKPACEKARQWLWGLRDHLCEAGLGTISEIFDGDAPHTPRGCIAQAWSVGEILRALTEDACPSA